MTNAVAVSLLMALLFFTGRYQQFTCVSYAPFRSRTELGRQGSQGSTGTRAVDRKRSTIWTFKTDCNQIAVAAALYKLGPSPLKRSALGTTKLSRAND